MSGPQESSRGTLVVVEGLDRSGKSTQCVILRRNLELRGHRVKQMRFPDRTTPIGKMIDQYLKGEAQQEDHVIHLLFSANRWEAAAQIKADIAAGLTVVIDRYYYSGCVYSAAKDVPGLDLRWARWPEVGLPRPDLCLFLDISADAAARRSGFGGERYENVSMQARVRELFQELRGTYDEDFHVIDAGQDSEAVEKEVLDAVLRTMDLVAQNGTGKHLRQVRP